MRFLRSLGEGDKFRPAHPRQESLNNRKMFMESTYKITKVFSQSPYTVICEEVGGSKFSGFYSLGPGTVVLLPKEPNPTEEEVIKFITPKSRRRVVSYMLLWDGKSDIRHLKQTYRALLKALFVIGKKEFTPKDINSDEFDELFLKFLGRPSPLSGRISFSNYRRFLIDGGYLGEVVDSAPVGAKITEANLHKVI